MSNKQVQLGEKGSELINKAKSKLLAENPTAKITDAITVEKALKQFLGEE